MTRMYFKDETARSLEIRTSLEQLHEEKKVLMNRIRSVQSTHVAESSTLKQNLDDLREKVRKEKNSLERSEEEMIRINGKTQEMRERLELMSSLKQDGIEESERSCRESQIEIHRLSDEEGRTDAEIVALGMKLKRLANSCSTLKENLSNMNSESEGAHKILRETKTQSRRGLQRQANEVRLSESARERMEEMKKSKLLLQSTIESDSVRLKECRKDLDDASREHRRLNRILNRRRKTHVSALESLKNALKGLDGDNDALRNGLNEILADCSGAIVGI